MLSPCLHHAPTMLSPCSHRGVITLSCRALTPCTRHALTMLSPCYRLLPCPHHPLTMLSLCSYHIPARVSSCPHHALTMLSSCSRQRAELRPQRFSRAFLVARPRQRDTLIIKLLQRRRVQHMAQNYLFLFALQDRAAGLPPQCSHSHHALTRHVAMISVSPSSHRALTMRSPCSHHAHNVPSPFTMLARTMPRPDAGEAAKPRQHDTPIINQASSPAA